ncbi:MAG: hypothetical protein GF311_22075 [Candidatus Lokiarchaeota archaeon]|nr:hypothetical protein [Candidatus Lokiarchaeota archaeon]
MSPSPLSELIIKTIEYCDEDLHENLYENIILTGWNAYIPDLANILKKDVKKSRPHQSIHIFSPINEYYNWYCASEIARQALKNPRLISFVSPQEFEENPNTIYYPRIMRESF